MGSLAEETPEDRRTENQSESHRSVIPPDGELRRDSDHILRVHAVHPKPAATVPGRRRSELEAEEEKLGGIGRTGPAGGGIRAEAVPEALVRDATAEPPSDVYTQMNQFLHSVIDSCPPGQAPPPRSRAGMWPRPLTA